MTQDGNPPARRPLCGTSAGGEVYVLGFRDVRRARLLADHAGGGEVVLVVVANLAEITAGLRSQGIQGVVIDWVPGKPVVEEARSLPS
jgi:hypothetical protein